MAGNAAGVAAAGPQATAPICAMCEKVSAVIFCHNDDAYLCAECDEQVHANRLASRHERVRLSECAAGVPVPQSLARPCSADPLACLMLPVKSEPGLDDFDLLLPAGSPLDSGSTQTGLVAFSGSAAGDQPGSSSNDQQQQQQEDAEDIPPLPVLKSEKDLDAFLDWDGALLDFGLELEAFEQEIMSTSLSSDEGVVPSVEPAESSCSGASGSNKTAANNPPSLIKVEAKTECNVDGVAVGFTALQPAHSFAQSVPCAMPPPAGCYAVQAAWSQHAVPQYCAPLQQPGYTVPGTIYPAAAYGAFYGAPTGYFKPDAQAAREARHASIKRYREKRNRRIFEKTIRYQSRKAYAEIRPRIKGRFAKREEVAAAATDADCLVPVCAAGHD